MITGMVTPQMAVAGSAGNTTRPPDHRPDLTRRRLMKKHTPFVPTHYIPRFWSRVDRRDDASCWLWLASCTPRGYGRFHYTMPDGRRIPEAAHRVSYMIHHGPIKTGNVIMHSCDTPACVNPAHLSQGTHKDNARDMVRKGRQRKSRRHNLALVEQFQHAVEALVLHRMIGIGDRDTVTDEVERTRQALTDALQNKRQTTA